MKLNRWLALVFALSLLLWPMPAHAAPANFQDVTLWLQHGQTYQPACFDLRVEARANGVLVATAETYTLMPYCTHGYATVYPQMLTFVNDPLGTVNPGDVVEVTVLARMAITRPAAVGSLRLWYDGFSGGSADSYVRADLGAGLQTYHFAPANQLSLVPPIGPALSNTQYQIWKPSYYSLGTWGRIAP